MLLRSKKGMILYYLVIFGFIMALGFFIVNSLYVKPKGQSDYKYPGEFQLKFLEETGKLEGKMFYLEQVLKASAQEASIDLAGRGGFKSANLECSFFGDYNFLNKGDKWCLPKYKENFVLKINENVSDYIKDFKGDYFVNGRDIYVVPEDDVSVEVYDGIKLLGVHSKRPEFKFDVGYNLSEYEQMFKHAKALISGCKGVGELDLCIDKKIKDLKGWKRGDCEGTGLSTDAKKKLFCVKSSVLRVFDGEKFKDEKVKYKFGLDFSKTAATT